MQVFPFRLFTRNNRITFHKLQLLSELFLFVCFVYCYKTWKSRDFNSLYIHYNSVLDLKNGLIKKLSKRLTETSYCIHGLELSIKHNNDFEYEELYTYFEREYFGDWKYKTSSVRYVMPKGAPQFTYIRVCVNVIEV